MQTRSEPRPVVVSVQCRPWVPARLGRLLFALAAIGLGALCGIREHRLRLWETEVLAWILTRSGLAQIALPSNNNGIPALTLHANDAWVSLRIIPQCAIAMHLSALLLLSAVLVMVRRVRPARLIAALIISGSGLILMNQARLATIAIMYAEGGRDAFAWAHGPIGSAMMLIGVAGSLVVFLLLCAGRAEPKHPAPGAGSDSGSGSGSGSGRVRGGPT